MDIDNLTWVFAKTMPETPHWYVVRSPANEETYLELFRTIEREGIWEQFEGYPYRYYWYRGDGYRYWAMTRDESKSRVINREKVNPTEANMKRGEP
jgi:hypothetical protein